MILLTPGKVFYGHEDNIYEITSSLANKYTWNKYNLSLQYKWNRYNVTTEKAYTRYSVSATVEITHPDFGLSSDHTLTIGNNLTLRNSSFGLVYSSEPTRSGNVWRPSGSGQPLTVKYNFDGEYAKVISWTPTSGYLCESTSSASNPTTTYIDYGTRDTVSARADLDIGLIAFTLHGATGYYLDLSNGSSTIVYGSYTEGYNSTATSYYQRSSSNDRQAQGSFVSAVTSSSSSAYPSNGISGSYWYVSNGSQQVKGSLVGTVESYDSSAYPDDGILDGYWYTKN